MADRRALVAGGSGGIGAACARQLAADGAEVVLTYGRRADAAEAVVADIAGAGGRASAIAARFPGEVGRALDGVSTVVWAVGPEVPQIWAADLDAERLGHALSVELEGFAGLVREALPHLRATRGSLVAVTSAGLARHPPGDLLSTAPKAGIEAIVRAVAREEGRHGVRANAVRVGVVDAGMFQRLDLDDRWKDAARQRIPLRRFGTADDVGHAVAFLASPRAAYITGDVIHVDGGYHG